MRRDTDGGSADLAPVVIVGREPYHRGALFLLPLDVVRSFGKYRELTHRLVQHVRWTVASQYSQQNE